MIDLLPMMVDGAIVLSLESSCRMSFPACEDCRNLAGFIHNWLHHTELPYVVIDLQDRKSVCGTLVEEVMVIRKRLRVPVVFAGVTETAQKSLEGYDYHSTYPFFFAPEDAVRALRMQFPGITEVVPKIPIFYGQSLVANFSPEQIDVLLAGTRKKQLLLSDW